MDRLLFLNLLLLLSIGSTSGKTTNAELPPFTKVSVCIPLAVSVRPTSSKDKFDYSIYIKAEKHVTKAIEYEVTDGVLYLSLSGDLTVNDPAHIIAILPADKLEAVENHGIATLLVESGFSVKSISLIASTGNIRADDVALDDVSIETSSGSTVVVEGTIQKATIHVDGFSKVATTGIQEQAKVKVNGHSSVFITGSPEKHISGSVDFIGNVFADESASCNLSSMFFGEQCKPITIATIPVVTHQWTSHMEFSGEAVCSAEKGYHVSTSVVTTEPGTGQQTFSSVTTVGPGKARISTHSESSVVGTKTAATAEAHTAGEQGSYTAASASTAHYGGAHVSPFPFRSPRRMAPKPAIVT